MSASEFSYAICGHTKEGRQVCVEGAALLALTGDDLQRDEGVNAAVTEMIQRETASQPNPPALTEEDLVDAYIQATIETANAHLGGNPYDPVVAHERDNMLRFCAYAAGQGILCQSCPLLPYSTPQTSTEE